MSIEGTELMMNANDPVAPAPDAATLRIMVIVSGLAETIMGWSGLIGIPSLIRTGPHVITLLVPTELLAEILNEYDLLATNISLAITDEILGVTCRLIG